MATQLKHSDFAFSTALTPRPNIRVAYIAGEATAAVHAAMAKLPAETRSGTLDDLTTCDDVALITSMTCSLIEKAQELLSPRMYTAFLRWGEQASHVSTICGTDEEATAASNATACALRSLSELPAKNMHDVTLKMLLAGIEGADCPTFGPFDSGYGEFDYMIGSLLKGLSDDLSVFSPIPALFDELSQRAWALSASRLAFSGPIGGAITKVFSFARGEDSASDRSAPTAVVMDGYDPFMRGPLIQWQRAYDRHVEANNVAQAHHINVELPADDRYGAVRAKWPTNYDFSRDPVAKAELDAADYPEVIAESNRLWGDSTDCRTNLYLIPAPSPVEFAIKMKLFEAEEDWHLRRANEIVKQLTYDARRFGHHGAHLKSDDALLAAFAGCRAEMEAFENSADMDEDAAITRVDAFEVVLVDERATTIEGVLAKFRVAFQHQNPANWSDYAVTDPSNPAFVEGLRLADFYDRLQWGAITDLARIAGVNLSEQGV